MTQLLYRTPDSILPPASFEVLAWVEELSTGLKVKITQKFTGREEIPLEEIEAEGFSENDGLEWNGILPKVWLEEWKNFQKDFQWKKAVQIHLIGLVKGENQEIFCPDKETEASQFAEELTQACLEISEKEMPMEMVLGMLEKNNFFEHVKVLWSFAERRVVAAFKNGKEKSWEKKAWKQSWQEIQNWIEEQADEEDLFQLPKSKGWFWLLNGEIWLPFSADHKGEIWDYIRQIMKNLK
jgi:hypothetical protein